jgi:hypothetical protein
MEAAEKTKTTLFDLNKSPELVRLEAAHRAAAEEFYVARCKAITFAEIAATNEIIDRCKKLYEAIRAERERISAGEGD